MRRVGNADREAFAELYDRFAAILHGIVLRIVRSRAEAEDVLQGVFLQIWQRAGSYDERRGKLVPWLTLLARSRALDRLRARDQRSSVAAAAAAELPGSPASDPAEDVIVGEEGLLVRDALEKISEDQRSALSLAYFEGLTQSQIAERLEKPLGTVQTQRGLGLQRLRELLGGIGAGR